jgi:hypothetical protein
MSNPQPETTQTGRIEPRHVARGLRHHVGGIVAACVLSLMQASANRRVGTFGIDSEAEW